MSYYDRKKYKEESKKVLETIHDVQRDCIDPIDDFRGIPQRVLKWSGVKVALSEHDGRTLEKIYFPYTEDGKVVGYQRKDLTLDKKAVGHFLGIGKCGVSNQLQLQNKCKGNKVLIITEGFLDALAVKYARRRLAKEKGWKFEPDVVSIGNGCANAVSSIGHNISFVERYDEVVLMFDGDSQDDYPNAKGKWGKEATEDVYRLLGPSTKVVQLPHLKDPCDVLKDQGYDALAWMSSKPVEFCPDEIVFGKDALLDEIMTPLAKGVFIPTFPKLMGKLKGLRPGELNTWTAPSGVGKSSVTAEIAYALATSGHKIGMIFLEEDVRKTQQRFIAMDLEVPLPKFRQDPSICSREDVKASMDRVLKDVTYVSHFGSINSERLINKIRYMRESLGCTHIVLDHLSMVISGQQSSNERKDIDMLMTQLCTICTDTGVGLHVVVHMKRKSFMPPSDKNTGEIIYPYWIPVGLDDLRGSAGLEQMSHNVIGIEPQMLEDGRGLCRFRVLKNREWSFLGLADVVKMNEDTGRMVTAEVEDYG